MSTPAEFAAPASPEFAERHPSTLHLLKFFEFEGLPAPLRPIGSAFHTMAHTLVRALPDDPELTAGLRKLMEARNCMVRLAFEGLHSDPA